jgi:hypothetical protein
MFLCGTHDVLCVNLDVFVNEIRQQRIAGSDEIGFNVLPFIGGNAQRTEYKNRCFAVAEVVSRVPRFVEVDQMHKTNCLLYQSHRTNDVELLEFIVVEIRNNQTIIAVQCRNELG